MEFGARDPDGEAGIFGKASKVRGRVLKRTGRDEGCAFFLHPPVLCVHSIGGGAGMGSSPFLFEK